MLVRVLGSVELVTGDGDTVSLPGARQPALLAALASRVNEVVSTDRLIALLWADGLPENPEAALHSTVFKLRASLRSLGRDVLMTRDRGYQLVLEPGDLDARVFSDLVAEAADQDPAAAAETLGRALALWRGRAYGTFADTEMAQLEALRLEEARRAAVEQRADALLAAGRASEAVLLLEPFVNENPLREQARSTLMRALHRAGRTAEALDQYQTYRLHLADDLGLEPSHAMQALQIEILQPPPQRGTEAGRRPGVAQLMADDAGPSGLPGLQVRYVRTPSGSVVAHGTTGTGPPLVVILGWVSSLEVIASGRDPRSSLLERLAHRLSLTLYDRTGTGLSPGPVLDYGLGASVEEVETVVREIGRPVALMAMSAAGPIAVALAARRPSWVSSLVLFGTFANGRATFTDKALRDMIVELARNHWGMGSKLLADLYRPGASDAAAWHLSRVLRDSASSDVAAEYLAATYDLDVEDLLPSVGAPALVLHYRGDRLVPFRGAQGLAAGLPKATLVALDGAVHLPDAVDLDHIERVIVEHVQRHAAAVGAIRAP